MDIASNSKFSWRAANAFALWRTEILSASVVFLCAALSFQALWQTNSLASRKIADIQERLSFVRTHLKGQEGLIVAPRHRQKADAAHTIAGIRQAAQTSGISVNRLSIKSEEVSKEKNISALPLEFSATAPQEALVSFMAALKNLDFLCRVAFLNTKPDPANDANLLLSLKLERLNLLAPVPKKILKSSAADFKTVSTPTPDVTATGRNIFKNIVPATRRNAPAASSDEDSLALKDLNLAGIIDNGRPKAIIENKKEAKTYTLAEGDAIGGFIVAAIANREVILEKNQSRYSLTL
jgi:hypothetical protein